MLDINLFPIIFTGYWKNNEKQGLGTYTFHNGDVFEGTYKNDMRHGYGVYHYETGNIYEWSTNLHIHLEHQSWAAKSKR